MAKYNPHPQSQDAIASKYASALVAQALSAYPVAPLTYLRAVSPPPVVELIGLSRAAAHS